MDNSAQNTDQRHCEDDHEVGKYISFRIRKDFNIEPETPASFHFKIGGVRNGELVREDETTSTVDESDEFLSAYEGDDGQGSTENSSASSFTFPVLDGRWSGSPVKMPNTKSEHKHVCCLRKPTKLIICRWRRLF